MKTPIFIPYEHLSLMHYLNINDIIYVSKLNDNDANIRTSSEIIYDCKNYKHIIDLIKYRSKETDKCFKELCVFNNETQLANYTPTYIFIDMNMIYKVYKTYTVKRINELNYYKYIIKFTTGYLKDFYDIEVYQSDQYMEQNFNRF